MSAKIVRQVLEHSRSHGAARLVLVALAEIGNDRGVVDQFPRSHKILASRANIGESTVPRAIRQLVDLGELEITSAGSGRARTDYLITVSPPSLSPPSDEGARLTGGSDETPVPPQMGTQGAQDEYPGGSSEGGPSLPPLSTPSLPGPSLFAGPSFEDFWAAYPKKTSKGAAEKRWARVVRKTDPALIVAGAQRYAAEVNGTPRNFLKDPAGWLHDQRWLDEPGANVRHHDRTPVLASAEDHGPSGVVDPKDL